MPKAAPEIVQLVALYDEGFSKTAWHGPTLMQALGGVTAEHAAWRPAPGRHNIWEVAVHAAYWKHVVRARLTGKREPFAFAGSNWFERPGEGNRERDWKADMKLLADEHRKLRDVVASFPRARLGRPVHGKRHTGGYTIRGIAAHDLYHAGQIQLLKALITR